MLSCAGTWSILGMAAHAGKCPILTIPAHWAFQDVCENGPFLPIPELHHQSQQPCCSFVVLLLLRTFLWSLSCVVVSHLAAVVVVYQIDKPHHRVLGAQHCVHLPKRLF
jgi:hypothetical protein